jgi:tetratricopeptide (TPR) repeat protein
MAVLAALAALAAVVPAKATTPDELFEAGNNAYEEGRYEEAASAYEKILAYGVRDPRVHYNLGNAYFKLGKLGGAILHYERALRLDPSDHEARDNLDFARSLIRDRVTEPQMPYPVQAVRGILDPLSTDRLALVFLLVYLLTGALAGAIPLCRQRLRRRILAYSAVVTGLCVAATGSCLAYKVSEATAAHAIVTEARVDVLSGPAEDNTILFTVHEGTRLEVRNRLDGWYQVSLPNALSGWVRAGAVERV